MSQSEFGDESRRALKALVDSLKRDREHLSVQIQLGKMELQEEWKTLEHKWDHFEDKVEDLGQDALEAATHFGQELKTAYEQLLDRLKRED